MDDQLKYWFSSFVYSRGGGENHFKNTVSDGMHPIESMPRLSSESLGTYTLIQFQEITKEEYDLFIKTKQKT